MTETKGRELSKDAQENIELIYFGIAIATIAAKLFGIVGMYYYVHEEFPITCGCCQDNESAD